VTVDLILLALVLVLAGNVYLTVRMRGHIRQLIAQVAVLTLRMIDAGEALEKLETDLRAELDREDLSQE
jgi:uncharacterized membrane protein (UPF0182 family)